MKGFVKVELVLKFSAEDQFSAEDKLEEIIEELRSSFPNSRHRAEVIETCIDATYFEEGTKGYKGTDNPY